MKGRSPAYARSRRRYRQLSLKAKIEQHSAQRAATGVRRRHAIKRRSAVHAFRRLSAAAQQTKAESTRQRGSEVSEKRRRNGGTRCFPPAVPPRQAQAGVAASASQSEMREKEGGRHGPQSMPSQPAKNAQRSGRRQSETARMSWQSTQERARLSPSSEGRCPGGRSARAVNMRGVQRRPPARRSRCPSRHVWNLKRQPARMKRLNRRRTALRARNAGVERSAQHA